MSGRCLIESEGTSINDKRLHEEYQQYYVGLEVDFQSTYKTPDGKLEWKDPTTTVAIFNEIVNHLDITGSEKFMDCGCGLGHVLYLASKVFKEVLGVEIVEEVVAQCVKNLSILLPNNTIRVFNVDMFKMGRIVIDSVDVFYVSNPFDKKEDFSRWRNIVEDSISSYDRNVYFIYYYPFFEADMAKSNLFYLDNVLSSNNGNVNIYRHRKHELFPANYQ